MDTSTQAPQSIMPGPYKSFQPQQQVVNPADGKNYVVQQQNPGHGVTLLDPNTQQTVMVSDDESQNLQPSLNTNNTTVSSLEVELDRLIGIKQAQMEEDENRDEEQSDEIPKESRKLSIINIAQNIVSDLINEKLPVTKSKLAIKSVEAEIMRRRWRDTRKKLKTRAQMRAQDISDTPMYNEPREIQEARRLGIVSIATVTDVGRDDSSGIPMIGGKDIEVGLTEFPAGVDKEKNPEGYSKYTFEEMDANFENDREHFRNEQLLPDNTKKREESGDWYDNDRRKKRIKELRNQSPQPRYSYPEGSEYKSDPKILAISSELDRMLGLISYADEEEPPESAQKLPIEFKETKTAPKINEYVEPNILMEANPDVRAAIEEFDALRESIDKIKNSILEKSKPLQQAIVDATKDLQTDLASKAALLKTALDLVYSELEKTEDKVGIMDDQIYAAIGRETAKAPKASLAQILKKADDVAPKIAEEIRKIASTIENDNTKLVLEQYLYKYPVSEVQKKKIQPNAAMEDVDANSLISELFDLLDSLKEVNDSI